MQRAPSNMYFTLNTPAPCCRSSSAFSSKALAKPHAIWFDVAGWSSASSPSSTQPNLGPQTWMLGRPAGLVPPWCTLYVVFRSPNNTIGEPARVKCDTTHHQHSAPQCQHKKPLCLNEIVAREAHTCDNNCNHVTHVTINARYATSATRLAR